MNDQKAYILFPGAAKNSLYADWLEQLPMSSEIVREYDTQWTPPDDAGIVITHSHYRWEEISILRRLFQETKVPLLILVDGILEYRNSFEHPDLADGSMFQPLIGHKLACLGKSQIRWIESWGQFRQMRTGGPASNGRPDRKTKTSNSEGGPFSFAGRIGAHALVQWTHSATLPIGRWVRLNNGWTQTTP